MSLTNNPRYPEAYEQDCTGDHTCEVHSLSERLHPSHDHPPYSAVNRRQPRR